MGWPEGFQGPQGQHERPCRRAAMPP